jgi:hypothetical protein
LSVIINYDFDLSVFIFSISGVKMFKIYTKQCQGRHGLIL